MTVSLLIDPQTTFHVNDPAVPASGYYLYFFVSGDTTTKLDTFTTQGGGTKNANPIVLNVDGQNPDGGIYLTDGKAYQVELALSTDTDPPTSPIWSRPNVYAGDTFRADAADATDNALGDALLAEKREETGSTDTTAHITSQQRDVFMAAHFGGTLSKTNGTDDWTSPLTKACDAARTAGVGVMVEYGKYKLTGGTEINAYRCNIRGVSASNNIPLFDLDHWPTFIYDSGLTARGMFRMGPGTDGTEVSDRTVFENITIDMRTAPNNAIGMYAQYGLNWATINNVYIRGDSTDTTAGLVTKNQTGFEWLLATSANHGLYYNSMHNLTAFALFRGHYFKGDNSDGLRMAQIGRLNAGLCVQQFSFYDTGPNDMGSLAIMGFQSDYDPSGKAPKEWGLWMDSHAYNNIGSIYVEAYGNDGPPTHTQNPIIFMSPGHQYNLRGGDDTANMVQLIDATAATRHITGKPGMVPGTKISAQVIETGTVGGYQSQKPLNGNPYFRLWDSGDSPVTTDAVAIAEGTYTTVKEGTGTLDIRQDSGSGNTVTHDSSCKITITTPQANKMYGIKFDLFDNTESATSKLWTLGQTFEVITVCAVVRPDSAETSVSTVRLIVADGVTTSNTDVKIDYNYEDETGQDAELTGVAGEWYKVLDQFSLSSNMTKFEVTFGLYPADTTNRLIRIDSILLFAGKHSPYGIQSYIESSQVFAPSGIATNTNAVPANADVQVPLIDPKTGTVYYLAGFTTI